MGIEIEIEIDRDTWIEIEKTNREINREINKDINRERNRNITRAIPRETNREINRETHRETNKKMTIEVQRYKQIQPYTEIRENIVQYNILHHIIDNIHIIGNIKQIMPIR